MIVTRIDIYEFYLPFRFAFKHAASARDANRTIVVKLTTDQGRVGFGEAIPRPYLTGESAESVVQTLGEFWNTWLKRFQLPERDKLASSLATLWQRAEIQNNLAAFAAIDVALWDLSQSVQAESRRDLVQRDRVFVLPLFNRMTTFAAVAGAKTAGYRRFKFKMNKVDQLGVLAQYKRLLSRNDWVVVDANMVFGVDEALFVARELKKMDVHLFEQPIAAYNLDDLARIERESGLPLLVDESLCSLQQAKDLVRLNAGSVWNVRIAKNGGITGAMELARLGQKHGKQIYSGCLVGETSLLHQAQSIFLAKTSDVLAVEDGFARLLLKKNPFRNFHMGSGSDLVFENNIQDMPRYYKASSHQ